MELHLRGATNDDREAVQSLVFGVLSEYGLAADPDSTDADLRDIEAAYLHTGGAFAVLEDSAGKIVGSVGLLPVSGSTCELRKMYLNRSNRGQGWGKKLLNHAVASAAALGFSRIVLETASVLKEAVHLYEASGFRRCELGHLSARCDAAYGLEIAPEPDPATFFPEQSGTSRS